MSLSWRESRACEGSADRWAVSTTRILRQPTRIVETTSEDASGPSCDTKGFVIETLLIFDVQMNRPDHVTADTHRQRHTRARSMEE